MANRSILHKTKLEDFKKWCSANLISTRPGKGAFQVLQVCDPVFGWGAIYDRIEAKEHYTADKKSEYMVLRFVRSQRSNGVANNNFDADKQ